MGTSPARAGTEAVARDKILSADVLAPLSGVYSVEYEQAVSTTSSCWIGAHYLSDRVDRIRVAGGGIAVGYHGYPAGRVLSGLFMGPFVSLSLVSTSSRDDPAQGPLIWAGIDLGWILRWGRFTCAPSIQVGYASVRLESQKRIVKLKYEGEATGYSIRLGMMF